MKGFVCQITMLLLLTACDSHVVSPLVVLEGPAQGQTAEPHLSKTMDGRGVLSWLSQQESGHALQYSVLDQHHWSEPTTVAAGEHWFVNWADFPSVEPISKSIWAAHWLEKKPGGSYAYDVKMSISNDKGKSWSTPVSPHRDETATEHGFASLFAMPATNQVGAVWLDGRNTGPSVHDHGGKESEAEGGMTLRFGQLSAMGQVLSDQEIDSLTCDCCQTDATLVGGRPIVVFRDRTTENVRDISIVRWQNNQWSRAKPIWNDGWQIRGCPVNGPAIAAEDDHVVVAWFTAANDEPRILLARSTDGGEHFSEPAVISKSPYGRVDVVLLKDKNAVVTWIGNDQAGQSMIQLRRVSGRGELSDTRNLMAISSARNSGFPQMVATDHELVFAWTDAAEVSRVRTAVMKITKSSDD